MKGLCQKCQSSNVETTLQDGIPVCVSFTAITLPNDFVRDFVSIENTL